MRYHDERGCFGHAGSFTLRGVGLTTLSRPLPAPLSGLPRLSRSAPRPHGSPRDTQEPSLWIPERGYQRPQRLGRGTGRRRGAARGVAVPGAACVCSGRGLGPGTESGGTSRERAHPDPAACGAAAEGRCGRGSRAVGGAKTTTPR